MVNLRYSTASFEWVVCTSSPLSLQSCSMSPNQDTRMSISTSSVLSMILKFYGADHVCLCGSFPDISSPRSQLGSSSVSVADHRCGLALKNPTLRTLPGHGRDMVTRMHHHRRLLIDCACASAPFASAIRPQPLTGLQSVDNAFSMAKRMVWEWTSGGLLSHALS